MNVEQQLSELSSHYQTLRQSVARLHYLRDTYVEELRSARYGQAGFSQDDAASAQIEHSGPLAWIALSWDNPVWAEYTPGKMGAVPAAVHVGRLELPALRQPWDLPALAPFLGQNHLFVTGEGRSGLLPSILLRQALTSPPRSLALTLIEAGGAGTELATFLHLPAELRGERVFTRPDDIAAQINRLNERAASVVQERLRNVYATVEAYNAANPATAVPYQVVAMIDLTAGLDERSWAALLQLARTGPRSGIYLLASVDRAAPLPRGAALQDLLTLGHVLNLEGSRLHWHDAQFGDFSVIPDVMPDAQFTNQCLDRLTEALAAVDTSLDFDELAIPDAQRWKGDSRSRLRAPIGRDSTGARHEIELGVGVLHHALVGGTTGSGKSNLLHVLLLQLAMAYSPDELELYLMDFREGVEFQEYLALPHARVIALETEREFALSILRRLHQEVETRGRRFAGVAPVLEDYRNATGGLAPRILLVIDEFQVLFSEEDVIARESARILEDLTRRGRGFGIHVLLSSQSPVMPGLYSRSLYEQMNLRIAFRCSAPVSEIILGMPDAARLTQPGQAIYNTAMGDRGHSREIRVARLTPARRRTYLEALHTLGAGRADPPPMTFAARAPARLERNPELREALAGAQELAVDDPAKAWLGEPVAVKAPTAALLERYEGSNLFLVGSDEHQAQGLLLAALLSLAAQRSPADAEFLVADFSRPTSPYFGLYARLGLPHSLTVLGPRHLRGGAGDPGSTPPPPRRSRSILEDADDFRADAAPAAGGPLDDLEARVNARLAALEAQLPAGDTRNLYLILAGIHGWRDLRPAGYETNPVAAQLMRIADRGPDVGVHLLVWTDALATFTDAFKSGGLAFFDQRVLLRLGDNESDVLLGSAAAARLADHRALLRIEGTARGEYEKFKPYAVPPADVLDELTTAIRRRWEGA